ncbi:MAG: bifunctional DNA primase/polymerase [Pseudomonadota bacterium]
MGEGTSPFAAAYEGLIANGFTTIPISPDSKAPSEWRGGRWQGMKNWQRFRDARAPDFIQRVWAGFPDANIGIVTGTRATAGQIVACVDFDTDDPDILDTLTRSLPPSPVRKRGRRGFSAFYLVPAGTVGYRTPICELLTDTRQTVVPPSIHPDTGQPYQWLGPSTLLNTPATALPALTDADLDRFKDTIESLIKMPIDPVKAVAPLVLSEGSTIWRRVNTTAYSNLDAWVPKLGLAKLQRTPGGYKAVATWRPSTRGRPLEQRACNLSISQAGAKDFGNGDTFTALNLVQTAMGVGLDEAFDWLSTQLGLKEAELPLPMAGSAVTAQETIDAATGEILPAPIKRTNELPDHLTRVPGLLGEVVEWIVSSARRPNRTLALGAAIPVIGTLMGQAIAGPTLSATHLYIVALAPTGAGKDHPLRSIMTILKGCNADRLVGPDEFISMPAVISFLVKKQLSVCPIDEIGAFLKRLGHFKASAYEKSVTKMLRSVWGASFRSIMTPEWAAKESKEIKNPAMSIYGVSTPQEFFSALEGDDIVNGFLNRFLLLTSETKAKDTNPELDPLAIPRDLALKLAAFRNAMNQIAPEDLTAPIGEDRKIKRMTWGAGAEAAYNGLKLDIDRISRDPEIEPYFARTGEMAVRLATIVAAGCGRMQVSQEDMAWGAEIALWSANRMADMAGSYIAENEAQRTHNRIIRIIAERGGRASHRDVLRALKGGVRSRDLDDVIKGLTASGVLARHETKPPGGGPPTYIYEMIKNPA